MPKNKFLQFWNLSADEMKPTVLNMYVYGQIKTSSSWWDGSEDDVVTSKFIKDLRSHPEAETINVYINSPGGEVFAATSIMRQLKSHSAHVNVFIDGIAASAATVIAMGGDTIHMSKSSLMMIHNPLTGARGDVSVMQKAIEVLNKVKNTIVATYKEKTGLDDAVLSEIMDKETWLEASEALEYGFIDKIIEDTEEDVIVNESEDLFRCHGVSFAFSNFLEPEVFKAKLATMQKTSQIIPQGGNENMTYEEFLASLTEDQRAVIEAHQATILANAVPVQTGTDNSALEEVQANLVNALAENTQLATKVAELEASVSSVVTSTPEDAIINAMSADAKALFLQAKADAEKAQALIAEMAVTEKFNSFKAQMAEYSNLPIDDTHMSALFELSNFNTEHFASMEQVLKIANAAMGAGFVPVGEEDGISTATDAYTEMENRIAKLRKESPEMAYDEAMKSVIKNDPALYDRYRDGK